MSDRCPSCGEEYIEHLGLIGTCAELQLVKDKCDRLQRELELTKMERNRAHVEAYRYLGRGPTVSLPVEVMNLYLKLVILIEEDVPNWDPLPEMREIVCQLQKIPRD